MALKILFGPLKDHLTKLVKQLDEATSYKYESQEGCLEVLVVHCQDNVLVVSDELIVYHYCETDVHSWVKHYFKLVLLPFVVDKEREFWIKSLIR